MMKVKEKRMLFLLTGLILAAGILGIMLWRYYSSPSSTVTLDVNPSIELQTNRLNQVVAVNPVNEDAKQLLAGYELKDNNLEAVIRSIVDRMILSGYLTPDKDNEILLTAVDGSSSPQLSESVNQIINSYLAERQLEANTILQTVNATPQEKQTALENQLSVGKLRLIEELMSKDNSLTLGTLSGMRISDLLALKEGNPLNLSTESSSQDTAEAASATVSPTAALQEDAEDSNQDYENADDAEDQDNEDSDIEDSNEDASGDHEDRDVVRSYSKNDGNKDASDIEEEDASEYEKEDSDIEEEDQKDNDQEDSLSIREESDNEDQDEDESRYENDEDGEDGGRHDVYAGEDREDSRASVESEDQEED